MISEKDKEHIVKDIQHMGELLGLEVNYDTNTKSCVYHAKYFLKINHAMEQLDFKTKKKYPTLDHYNITIHDFNWDIVKRIK